jgi:hypothetical protein
MPWSMVQSSTQKEKLTKNDEINPMIDTCVASLALEVTSLPSDPARRSEVAPKPLCKSTSELKDRGLHSDSHVPNPMS